MKKIIISISFILFSSSNAFAWTVFCANCSNFVTQIMERVTSLQDLQYSSMEYLESVKQTYQQIELVKNNIQQYANMLQNTAQLPQNLINKISSDLTSLGLMTSSLSTIKADMSAMGGIYEKLYPEASKYEEFASKNYEERADRNIVIRSENDAMSQRIDEATKATFQLSGEQLKSLQEAGELESYINSLLTTPTGQMQAISSGNQLASLQLQEARQLRELLATQVQADNAIQSKEEKERQLSEKVAREITDMSDFDLTPKVQELPLF